MPGDICQYIQGDEALHQEDFPKIKEGFAELNSVQICMVLFLSIFTFMGTPMSTAMYERFMSRSSNHKKWMQYQELERRTRFSFRKWNQDQC